MRQKWRELELAIGFAAWTWIRQMLTVRTLVVLIHAGTVACPSRLEARVGGLCVTDFPGYPDCRRATMDAMATAMRLGMDRPTPVETPLMYLDKAQTWALAEQLGGKTLVDLIVEETHTCYLGDRSLRHDWGYGCGTCPACELRAKGWAQWRAQSRQTG